MAKKRSIYRNPAVSHRQPLDSSQVDDRRPTGSQAGGGSFDGRLSSRDVRSTSGTLGRRPRPASDVRAESTERGVERAVQRGSATGMVGADRLANPRKKKMPWGLTKPGPSLAEKMLRQRYGGK